MRGMSRYGAAALCAAALLGPVGAEAQGVGDWQYRAAIYGYLPSISGTLTLPGGGGSSSVKVDAEDILENLQFAFMGTFEARKGLWGVYSDLLYVNLGNSKTQSRDFSLGGQGLPADVTADVSLDMKGWEWMLAGTYQAVATPQYTLDLLFGTRLLDFTEQLDWTLRGNIGSVPVPDHVGSSSQSVSNWDAVVGVKGRVMLGDDGRWFVPYHFDIGAGQSRLTWQAVVGLGYTYRWGDIVAGWRYLAYDLKSGTAIESLNFNGPAIAVGFRW